MLKKLLEQNWIPVGNADDAVRTCPETLPFFQEDFIRRYYPIAQLPEDKLEFVIATASEFDKNELIRQLGWFMYLNFSLSAPGVYKPFPEFIFQLGYDTGILYLLICLSLIPELEARAERENFPMRYAHDAATRIGTFPVFFAQAFEGRFGIRSRSITFMLHYRNRPMYRIGRFDYMLERAGERFPHVYSRGSEVKLFCVEGWRLDKDGERLSPNEKPSEGERVASFCDNGTVIRGLPIDISTGLAEKEEIEISAKEWKHVASPGDWTLHFHIPGGGKMTPEACEKSFKEALEFFAEKYPESPVKLIFTVSWIANHAWLDYLPNSNIAALIRSTALFPSPHPVNGGLYFVFGRDDNDYASYPRTNSLERAMLDCIADGRPLRTPGMIVLPLPQEQK